MFILKRCFRRFMHAGRYYIWIMIELAMGASILLCQDSVRIAVQERLAAYERQFMEDTISIISHATAEHAVKSSKLPVTYDDYLFFLQEYPEDTEIYYMQYGSIFLGENISVLGVSGNKFQQLTGLCMEDGIVWIGRDVLERIDSSRDFAGQICSVRGNTIFLYGSGFTYRVLDEVKNPSIINFHSGAGGDISAAKCIFMPIEFVPLLEESPFFQATLEVGGEAYRQNAEEMIRYLGEENELYRYQAVDRRQVYLRNSKDFSDDIELLGWIGRFALLLTVVGIVGIMLVHLDERKKDFAVTMVVGGTKLSLAVETALEIFLFCMIGGAAALCVSVFAAPALSTSQYLVRLYGHSTGLLAVLVVGMTVIVCGVLLSCVEMKEPAAALKEIKG